MARFLLSAMPFTGHVNPIRDGSTRTADRGLPDTGGARDDTAVLLALLLLAVGIGLVVHARRVGGTPAP